MISSASHQDKDLMFLNNKIFVRRGELIFPLRINAKRFKMSYSEMRTFILRLVRRKMITTRTNQLQPTSNHPNRKVTLIKLVNYDEFQYVDNQQPPPNHLSQQVLNNNTNKHILISSNKNVNKISKEYEQIGTEDHYVILRKKSDGKKYLKHKWRDEPLKDY